MVKKFTTPTNTILDNYKTFKAFTQDKNVTEQQLIDLINNDVYWSGTCRHISRHINCTEEVFLVMRQHKEWFVRLVGYFCYRISDEKIIASSTEILKNNVEDVRVLRRAVEHLGFYMKKGFYINSLDIKDSRMREYFMDIVLKDNRENE